MKINNLLNGAVLAGVIGLSGAVLPVAFTSYSHVSAQNLTAKDKIDQITAVKGKPDSAQLLRKFYKEDLSPIGIQPGGAGMVVNLYSKKDDTTASLCTTFDVVVAIKKGKVAKFPAAEVK